MPLRGGGIVKRALHPSEAKADGRCRCGVRYHRRDGRQKPQGWRTGNLRTTLRTTLRIVLRLWIRMLQTSQRPWQ